MTKIAPNSVRLARRRTIGWSLWDPIGLLERGASWEAEGNQAFANEYDSYLAHAADLLRQGVSDSDVVDYLAEIEISYMGLGERPDTRARAMAVVAALRTDELARHE